MVLGPGTRRKKGTTPLVGIRSDPNPSAWMFAKTARNSSRPARIPGMSSSGISGSSSGTSASSRSSSSPLLPSGSPTHARWTRKVRVCPPGTWSLANTSVSPITSLAQRHHKEVVSCQDVLGQHVLQFPPSRVRSHHPPAGGLLRWAPPCWRGTRSAGTSRGAAPDPGPLSTRARWPRAGQPAAYEPLCSGYEPLCSAPAGSAFEQLCSGPARRSWAESSDRNHFVCVWVSLCVLDLRFSSNSVSSLCLCLSVSLSLCLSVSLSLCLSASLSLCLSVSLSLSLSPCLPVSLSLSLSLSVSLSLSLSVSLSVSLSLSLSLPPSLPPPPSLPLSMPPSLHLCSYARCIRPSVHPCHPASQPPRSFVLSIYLPIYLYLSSGHPAIDKLPLSVYSPSICYLPIYWSIICLLI